MSFENVLLIQTAFIGDVVLTTPMIRALRRSLPNARITVAVRPDASVVIRPDPHIDEIVVIDKKKKHKGFWGMLRLGRELRAKQFDLLLSPHMSHRTAFLAFLTR
ncbi:MAG: glycosyltransferase family 9 protein, partial [Spirochaetia bacterium]|nr:glycosyltransferase family 9 protein [Spirochaetia bacterium]